MQLSGGGAYSNAPTIAYTPLQGEGFVKSVLRSISIEDLFALTGSGMHHDAIREIKQLLGLDQNLDIYHDNSDFLEHRPDTISIRSRSLMSIFFYLSYHTWRCGMAYAYIYSGHLPLELVQKLTFNRLAYYIKCFNLQNIHVS